MRPAPRHGLAQLARLALASTLLACSPAPPADTPQKPPRLEKHYGPGHDGLRALWLDILGAAQRDEREKVHELMASMMLSDEDGAALFGDERARWLRPRYLPMYSRLVNVGAMELVAQVADQKYDDVGVFPQDAQSKEPEARAVAAAVPPGTEVFGARVKRKTAPWGLRYDFFVYRDGRWVTGNQVGRYLLPPFAPPGGPAAAATDAKAAAPAATGNAAAAVAAPAVGTGNADAGAGKKSASPTTN